MRSTTLRPVEMLQLRDKVRLAEDTRRFAVLSIEPPGQGDENYRLTLQAEDGLTATLVTEAEERIPVWV